MHIISGGYFEYKQYHVSELASDITSYMKELDSPIENNDDGEYNYHPASQFTPEQLKSVLRISNYVRNQLMVCGVIVQRLDWLASCDDGFESFEERLGEELEKVTLEIVELEKQITTNISDDIAEV